MEINTVLGIAAMANGEADTNTAAIANLAGTGRTTETVVANSAALAAIAQDVTDVEQGLAAIDNGGGLVESYVHSGNIEAAVSAVDVDTNIFTSIGHGLADGNLIVPVLNQDAGNVYPITVYAGGVTATKYYVINKTDDTFQISLTSGGEAVDITTNESIDLTKWHFEKYAVTVVISDLPPAKKYRVVIQGRQPNPTTGGLNNNFLVNGISDDGGKAIKETGTTYSIGDNSFKANVYMNLEVLIDFTDALTLKIKGYTTNCTAAGAFATTVIDRVRTIPTKIAQDIVSFSTGNWVVVNGLTIQVFDMALAKSFNVGVELEKVYNKTDAFRPFYASPNTLVAKPMIGLIDDDARATVMSVLYPILAAKGVVGICAACRPEVATEGGVGATTADLLALEAAGWEIACHGNYHKSLALCTDEEAILEIRGGKERLAEMGLSVDNYVYPFNATTDFGRNLISKYYTCATAGGINPNVRPVNQYRLERCPFGSYYVHPTDNTYDFYKSKVDAAIANNGWLLFMLHSWAPEFDATQRQHLSDIIDYCLANDVEIATMKTAIPRFGNLFEVDNTFKITNQGIMYPGPRYVAVEDVEIGSLEAGKSKLVTVPVGFTVTGRSVALNIPGLPAEFIAFPQASGTGVSIRFFNTHTGTLDAGTKDINLTIL